MVEHVGEKLKERLGWSVVVGDNESQWNSLLVYFRWRLELGYNYVIRNTPRSNREVEAFLQSTHLCFCEPFTRKVNHPSVLAGACILHGACVTPRFTSQSGKLVLQSPHHWCLSVISKHAHSPLYSRTITHFVVCTYCFVWVWGVSAEIYLSGFFVLCLFGFLLMTPMQYLVIYLIGHRRWIISATRSNLSASFVQVSASANVP